MFARILAALREHYIGFQLLVFVAYLVLDACGFGLGIFSHIANRPFTNSGKFHIGNLFVGAPPTGPNRLTFLERAAVKARIATTFGAAPPKTTHLAEMLWLFRPKNVLCVWKPDNIAMDAKDCNQLANAHPYYLALLGAMHPKTELLLYYGKRPLGTTAVAGCCGAPDRVKLTVLDHVDKDGKAHGCRDHFAAIARLRQDGRAPAPLA